MEIKLTSPNGIILKTAGKQCEEDITVIPELETSGGDNFPADKYFEGGHAEVNLPNATKIKSHAFYKDTVITNISMPNATEIGESAFDGCYGLALSSLPSNLRLIAKQGFYDCYAITIDTIPPTIEELAYRSFGYCTKLRTLTFKGTPQTINSTTFYACTNLKTINVPWAEGAVSGAPWGATNATINYNYTGE